MNQQRANRDVAERQNDAKHQRHRYGSAMGPRLKHRAEDVQHSRWLDQNVPTVPAQEPSEIDRKATQHQRHECKYPTERRTETTRHDALHVDEREITKNESRAGT